VRTVGRYAFTAALAVALQTHAAQTGAASDGSTSSAGPGVGAQYDGTHVYVAPADMTPFITSFTATFGGQSTKPQTTTVTPTPSSTTFAAVQTPVGPLSVFAFTTPVPYPFGAERTGYLVNDMDVAVSAAKEAGADVLVAPFPDPIGRDAVIQWPGGANSVYVSPLSADAFIAEFLRFSKGNVVSDNGQAPGVEIGRPGDAYRRVRIASAFGKLTLLVTDGHLPFPYGRELTGYEVRDLTATLDKAKAAGAQVLVEPFEANGRDAAMVQFPGGYIAEIHAVSRR
jgi:predicted enzyme related to lactoylglutathione lyase